ncbi:c-type cytochrome [Stieleria sp. TO1_6]|uniref:PVC-type heme-binding CxxCH protein n=1 Tax=Stieleria tagensis TaxID=2956795 RepID=UPI00209A9302|nr:PVC-type heme-binding CxxCH protein [Stieleria tagensis]MCO8124528.1 c-type cytochrome [Stieleria tagensis]
MSCDLIPRLLIPLLMLGCTVAEPSFAQSPPEQTPLADEFAKHVRSTLPLSPDAERSGFRLPPGFEIQLFAAEPDIAKPMNMAFDMSGRLWVTSSEEYPLPADGPDPPRDTIKILEDTNGDGRADSVTTFADGLNIPIGLYPYRDGVICFSIPNILFLRDTDGDGKADQREVLYGPFDTSRDTHGMCNAFTRGFDGWLYACHGFNNQSTVSGSDGHVISMSSGNTFRMRLDGSRIENFSFGQVNPFGMAFDSLGDLFSADCHTKPVTLLMRGGYSPSFGAAHDGLGFVPPVMEHLHGSTAIGGLAIDQGSQFPTEFNSNAFGGNVMTGRINRNLITHDERVIAKQQPDFLVASDPWFRPVDLQFGPDGALYVADFYNRIIGHYEVPLDHPGRDRRRGRIWRITYHGDHAEQAADQSPVSTTIADFVGQLKSPNLVRRMMATDALVDRFGQSASREVRRMMETTDSPTATIQALWFLHRTGELTTDDLQLALDADQEILRVHAFRILGERKDVSADPVQRWFLVGLNDPSMTVVRVAAMAMCQHPDAAYVAPLLARLHDVDSDHSHLQHALRLALRSQLNQADRFQQATESIDSQDQAIIAAICLAIPETFAANYVVQHLDQLPQMTEPEFVTLAGFASRYADQQNVASLIEHCQRSSQDRRGLQAELLRAIASGQQQRGASQPLSSWNRWAEQLVRDNLQLDANGNLPDRNTPIIAWTFDPIGSTSGPKNLFQVTRRRTTAGGSDPLTLISSLPLGEGLTGVYRSGAFALPQQFQFYLAGHDGFPDQPAGGNNLVRVVAVDTGETLAQWPAPRSDIAQLVQWQSAEHGGRQASVEIVDADDGKAYAWIAAGEFSIPALNSNREIDRRIKAAELASEFSVTATRALFAELLQSSAEHPPQAKAFARATLTSDATAPRKALAESLGLSNLAGDLRNRISVWLSAGVDATSTKPLVDSAPPTEWLADAAGLLGEVVQAIPADQQRLFANLLSRDGDGVEVLAGLVEGGKLPAGVLTDASIRQQWELIASADQRSRLQSLAENAAPVDRSLLEVVSLFTAESQQRPGDSVAGQAVFKTQCAACHQVAGVGKSVGPNLDGIGIRGLERIMEDVLMPNQNVDIAFRSSVILTIDGQVVSGLVKRDEGAQIVVVTSEGTEVAIAKDEIQRRKEGMLSPMPTNFSTTIKQQDLMDLVAYLLSLRE